MKITTTKGREIDITALRENYGTTRAIGNSNLNARGDVIKNGRIVLSSEQIKQSYYESARSVEHAPISLRDISDEMVMTPAQVVASLETPTRPKRKTRDSED